ncbi:MAG: Fe-S protein assembly co-chaperone HscB [Candidatus Methylophosphatis roskildensis]|jgi:molecular chaperone HscB|uniref:Co-chaperone protein HscB homolog n=1 Tax=Candidatus Methylophosphatis roskildensis TaxID=2899263 RepID=A0A9D7E3K7_9PROT|nr:Fe-S protein assembly co-chaperone HscB [Candidatus Methylophosphatis roskildensis]MBK7236652.1 Fe-S protein assembly co-chaperone HscB [Sterolibacteriaceae bacterium]
MSTDFSQDFFALFGLTPNFHLDPLALETAYHDLQTRVHPDKFAHLPDADKRVSMQWATRINEAYRTLKSPLARAQYLLHLRGVDTATESNTTMPSEFLIEQMEWREAVDEARVAEDADELEKLLLRLKHQYAAAIEEIERDLDKSHDYPAAAAAVRRLMFVEKLQHDLLDAIESLES